LILINDLKKIIHQMISIILKKYVNNLNSKIFQPKLKYFIFKVKEKGENIE